MNPFSFLLGKVDYENYSAEQFGVELSKDKNAVLLDVRTKEEHIQFRIPGSKLLDMSTIKFNSEIEKLDKSKSYYVYCASGARSRVACNALKKAGVEKVYNLSGGVCSWTGKLERNKK